MDRTELKNTLREEGSSSIKGIHPDFFEEVAEYVKELEEEIDKINNPRSVESKMLEDELQSAMTDVEVIFIRRLKKTIVTATTTAFSNRPPQDIHKLLPEERRVYDAVLSTINTARQELLEPILDPHAGSKVKEDRKPSITEESAGKNAIAEKSGQGETGASPETAMDRQEKEAIGKSNINEEFVVVRILEDLPTFKAMDNRNYTLRAEDVVVLPALNAKGLVKRNVAQMITTN
ncbi:hypothetical protein HWN40_02435 [Methanolobus zinderi]|jgi:DNA replication factor GINS|uniref:DNA replication complex GINS family protein n=1 Tax=Methanolobus zinderi TaxID=536044 RepID=A0A7D5I3Z6_9EURY|nr:hypothetical protein [Methanolobus zinderi]QLC49203.1 hypothetical protein HWN40_02435 [Methanolobus zinderi]